ncbi:MAG: hypothetical protein J6I58_00755 [Eubacterium sp.]|nr:hypothetical protein [Eubacterium sp.]MBR1773653.1 hypothetical protein [Eubacterium sp.]
MKNRIVAYLKYIDEMLDESSKMNKGVERDWDKEIERHLTQIRFFAHERLVHLIVFCLVAICTVMSILAFVIKGELMILPLIVLLFVLLVPYCMHYYLLENSVQKMYDQYDAMINKRDKYFSMKK